MTKAEMDRMDRMEDKIDRLQSQIAQVQVRVAYYMGGLAVLADVLNLAVEKGWF